MNTWEMIKTLTESPKPFGEQFFFCGDNSDEPIICFLRPQAGSIEFRLFRDWDESFVADNPILYPTNKWVEVTKGYADIWLEGRYGLL